MGNLAAPKIIVISGPTGSGKTSFAIKLARKYKGRIISADSMQIYRYMDIGTAKPTAIEQKIVPHDMIDIIDPDMDFNAAMYADMGGKCIHKAIKENFTPFVVGGTGLYIKALIHGLFYTEEAVDQKIRSSLKEKALNQGVDSIYEELKTVDRETAEKIHPNDTYRIIRALEVYRQTGKPISSHKKDHRFLKTEFNALKICINIEREKLYQKIDKRADQMVLEGLIQEIESLLHKGYLPQLKSMQSIGYRHILQYLSGKDSLDNALYTMKRDTRRYAKRQLTWLRPDKNLHFVPYDQPDRAYDLISNFIEN